MSDRHPAFRTRAARVEIKIRRLHGKGLRAARTHLRYIERDGVTRDGECGFVYSATEDRASGREFIDRCRDDRHQFRITASAKDGDQYEDLKPLIRRFMSRVEQDLGTGLDWVAADHADTRHPHTHILLRGRDDCGEDLVIAPNYFYHGMRERLAGIVSLELGPATEIERVRSLHLEIEAERVTSLEHRLLEERDETGAITIPSRNMVEHSVLTGRLHKLGALGLAAPLAKGRWRVADELEEILRTLGERSRMAQTLHQDLIATGIKRAPTDEVVHDSEPGLDISGRLVASGLATGTSERHYLIIDAVDGRSHYLETGNGGWSASFSDGAIVRLIVSEDAAGRIAESKVQMQFLSHFPLKDLPHYDGPTLLDHELVSPRLMPRDLGFGRELRSAMAERRNWLIEHGLASTSRAGVTFRADMLSLLESRELMRTTKILSGETGHVFATIEDGREIDGVVRRRIDLASRRFAMVDNGYEFTLVPWEPTLERALGKAIRATVGASGLSWTLCREREIEI